MQSTSKKILSTLALSSLIFVTYNAVAAQEPSESLTNATSVNNIDTVEKQLSQAFAKSPDALKSKVKSLSGLASNEAIAVALTNLGVTPSLSLQAMVEAGVSIDVAVGALIAANTENAIAIVKAALKLNPSAKASIISAAIGAGASPDDITSATAAGGGNNSSSSNFRVAGPVNNGSVAGGGGVVLQSKPVSPN